MWPDLLAVHGATGHYLSKIWQTNQLLGRDKLVPLLISSNRSPPQQHSSKCGSLHQTSWSWDFACFSCTILPRFWFIASFTSNYSVEVILILPHPLVIKHSLLCTCIKCNYNLPVLHFIAWFTVTSNDFNWVSIICVCMFKDNLPNTLLGEVGRVEKGGGMVRERKVVYFIITSYVRLSYLHDACDFNGHLLIVSVQMGERLLGQVDCTSFNLCKNDFVVHAWVVCW